MEKWTHKQTIYLDDDEYDYVRDLANEELRSFNNMIRTMIRRSREEEVY